MSSAPLHVYILTGWLIGVNRSSTVSWTTCSWWLSQQHMPGHESTVVKHMTCNSCSRGSVVHTPVWLLALEHADRLKANVWANPTHDSSHASSCSHTLPASLPLPEVCVWRDSSQHTNSINVMINMIQAHSTQRRYFCIAIFLLLSHPVHLLHNEDVFQSQDKLSSAERMKQFSLSS